jgi:tyrosyl-tRNA synthetase
LEQGLSVLEAYILAHLVMSKSEARRQIKGGGLRVNDAVVVDENMILTLKDVTAQGFIKLSFGKKRHVLLRPA